MTVLQHPTTSASSSESTRRTVLVAGGDGLRALPLRRRDAVLARLRSHALDDRLAAGVAPESGRVLAARATQLIGRRYRHGLARSWDQLAVRARRPVAPFDPHVPVVRSQIDAAADEIQRVADVLRSDRPLSARGVALAGALLTTAASPVYDRAALRGELAAAVARAVEQM